ncbi:MAG TPA: peptidyl-alpha-hydroxyglycine alpha-amidating lyase family protein [Chloroflexota bacterium]|nr:peptidyl-alpha-hydroxyglycine alpha-amidating lyase family protein [Chloroflexota bacterium]
MATVEQELRYRVVEGWEKAPANANRQDAVGVGVDSRGRVYLVTRVRSQVLVYEQDGTFVAAWGEGQFTDRTHGLTVAPDDTVWVVDDGAHTVRKYTADGKLLLELEARGRPAAESGYDGRTLESIARGGPPFNRPTNVAVAPNGDLYVSDGYGNCRVHRFSPDGKLIQSWGEPGTGPGQFILPHGIWVAPDGRVLLADRENDRIQVFSPSGEYLAEWAALRPTDVCLDAEGRVYVSELGRRPGPRPCNLGEAPEQPGRVSVLDQQGNVLARFGASETDRAAAGNFVAPHCIAVDAEGAIYVGEVTHTIGVRGGLVPEGTHTFQKFERV